MTGSGHILVAHGLKGASVELQQWESGNAHVRFPFADDSAAAPGYPFDAIVDACVVVPAEAAPSDETISVGCLHLGPEMVSVVIYADDQPILFHASSRASFSPFSPVAMRPIRPGCSGMVSFGDIAFDRYARPVIFRDMVRLAEPAVVRPVVGRLRRFIQPERGAEASGVVGIVVPDGVSVGIDEETGHGSTIVFGLDDAGKNLVKVACDLTEPKMGSPVPISSINGVHPDSDGRIAIVFAKSPEEVQA